MRQIDWSKPLSDEDRAWAEQRGDLVVDGEPLRDKIARNDQENGIEAKKASQTREERIKEIDAEMAQLQNEKERLINEQAEEDRVNRAFGGTPDDARLGLGFVDNTGVDGKLPEGAPEPEQDYSDEKYWTVARLQQEIDNRNRDREADGVELLARTGKRAELVERLQQDDREVAEAQES